MTRSIARIGARTRLIAWAFPDNHGHLAIDAPAPEASHLAWRVELATQAYRPTGSSLFLHRWLRTDTDYSYLQNMTDYILRQSQHHGTTSDPFAESDCRLDLLGLRCAVPWARARIRAALPRLRDEEVCDRIGVTLQELRNWSTPVVPGDGLEWLAEATRATFALRSVRENSPDGRRARAAAVLACPDVRPGRLAEILGLHGESIRRIRRGHTRVAAGWIDDPFLWTEVRAVAAQARWRARRREEESVVAAAREGAPDRTDRG